MGCASRAPFCLLKYQISTKNVPSSPPTSTLTLYPQYLMRYYIFLRTSLFFFSPFASARWKGAEELLQNIMLRFRSLSWQTLTAQLLHFFFCCLSSCPCAHTSPLATAFDHFG
ncbi:hypothetical protein, unlikely [Trypanosoma congolense IL3000]|uniref:Uncharacterized protein n=1 Tax=Trypanosoma congolense (strain IL3000) TaxID=1068625 RepID=F9W764_TRYCI|nr:hypothetical protein, unlikely [Trypanosoma congolense IL3000]